MSETRFLICQHCGNIVRMVRDSGVPVVCCGEPMSEIVAGTVDASLEKHVPAARVEGDTLVVEVGAVPHPMIKDHYIEWVVLQTAEGLFFKALKPGDEPKVTFALGGEKPLEVLAYCNLHGLWKAAL